jgi:outer membrane immunogenic protein
MRRFYYVTIAAVCVFGFASMPSAADMRTKAPDGAPVISWTGFYIGLNAGDTWSDNPVDVTTTNSFNNSAALSSLGMTYGPAAAAGSSGSVPLNSNYFSGGGQIGYNYELAPRWVAGIEADIQGVAHNTNSATATNTVQRAAPSAVGNTVVTTINVTQNLDYLGTVRGRLGYLVEPALWAYATGGLAYGGVSSDTSISGGEVPNTGSTDFATAGSFSGTRTGWTVGGGAEWLFAPSWSVKVEYLYYDLGTVTYSNGQEVSVLTGSTINTFINNSSSSVHFCGNLIHVGLNWHF